MSENPNNKEETEIFMQIRKFCFPDLSDLIVKFNGRKMKAGADSRALKPFKILFKSPLDSERYTFVLTKSGGTRLYGHCCRVFGPHR